MYLNLPIFAEYDTRQLPVKPGHEMYLNSPNIILTFEAMG